MPSKSRSFLASPEGLQKLEAAKAELNLSFAAIAKQAGVSADTVSRLFHPERGKRVSEASLVAIAQVLAVAPEDIATVEDSTKADGLAEAQKRIQAAIENEGTERTFSTKILSIKKSAITIFFSYSHKDKELRDKLATHLEVLKLSGDIVAWHDGEILAGEEWDQKIKYSLNSAQVILLLVSSDFIASQYCRDVEIRRAMERHEAGEACVVPIILRKCVWDLAPFGKLHALPTGSIPVRDNAWPNLDDAFTDITEGIRKIVSAIKTKSNLHQSEKQQERKEVSLNISNTSALSITSDIAEGTGAALSSDSSFYIEREADHRLLEGMQQKRALIHIKGAKQIGKTSLIIRQYKAIQNTRDDLRTALVDFQLLTDTALSSSNNLWHSIIEQISNSLDIIDWEEKWKTNRAYNINVSQFLSGFIFNDNEKPILICFDGVDRIFNSPTKQEFFSAVRSFYNRGAHHPIWKNIRWVLSTSTEPSFFIEDGSQSPFNVGSRIELEYFGFNEIQSLSKKYNLELSTDLIHRLINYLGGHPYLTHTMLKKLANDSNKIDKWFVAETGGNGLFKTHLDRYVVKFQSNNSLLKAMKKVIEGHSCKAIQIAYQLEGAGLTKRDSSQKTIPMCELYAVYFGRILTNE